MTGQDVAERTPAAQLVATVRSPGFQEQVKLALPEGMPPSRFVRIAATALLENPDIARADPDSVFNALLKAAGDGLLPDAREAALVLFQPKTGPPKAQYMPMIGGFRKIAAEHGWTLRAYSVWAEDEFTYTLGAHPTVEHVPAPLGSERTKIVAAYAVGDHHATGQIELEVMTAAEVAKVRRKAKSQAIWNEWEERMTEKTVGRRLFKRLPLGDRDRVRRVLDADELTPAAAAALVYDSPADVSASTAGDREAATPTPSPAEEPAAAAAAAPAPPPFSGAEPQAKAAPAAEKVGDYHFGEAWEGSRYYAQTLADVVAAGDREYLEWLASDAIEDEELRVIAAAALEGLS